MYIYVYIYLQDIYRSYRLTINKNFFSFAWRDTPACAHRNARARTHTHAYTYTRIRTYTTRARVPFTPSPSRSVCNRIVLGRTSTSSFAISIRVEHKSRRSRRSTLKKEKRCEIRLKKKKRHHRTAGARVSFDSGSIRKQIELEPERAEESVKAWSRPMI